MSDADRILSARSTLAEALADRGVTPKPEAIDWLLSLVWGESRLGQSPDWTIPNDLNTPETNPDAPPGPTHNWGAVRAAGSAPFVWHHDRTADGSLETVRFARFPSALAGAKHFLSVLLRGDVPAVLSDPASTEHDLAAGMFANHYFTGTTGTADDRINAYASMIRSGAAKVASAGGGGVSSRPTGLSGVVPSGLQITARMITITALAGALAIVGVRAWKNPSSLRLPKRIRA